MALVLLLPASIAYSAPPELKHLFPVAGQRGTSVAVSIGKTDTWPSVWADTPGVKFTPTPVLGVFNVDISADAPADSQ